MQPLLPLLRNSGSVLLAAILLLPGCITYKKLRNRAQDQAALGRYQEAMALYMKALERRPDDVFVTMELADVSSQVRDDILGIFHQAVADSAFKEAVYTYKDITRLQGEMGRYGIDVEIPQKSKDAYAHVRTRYVQQLFEKGYNLMEQGQYAAAMPVYDEILRWEPNNPDAQRLKQLAITEDLYGQGVAEWSSGRFRTAYGTFEQVSQREQGFRKTDSLMQLAWDAMQFTINIEAGTSNYFGQLPAQKLKAYLVTNLTNHPDPTLHVTDRGNLYAFLPEVLQQSGTTPDFKELDALLTLNVLDVKAIQQPVKKTTQKGYLHTIETTEDTAGNTTETVVYQPVNYFHYTLTKRVELQVQVNLISATTGQILASDVKTFFAEDVQFYNRFKGNVRKLYPMDSKNQRVTNMQEVTVFRSSFRGTPQNVPPEVLLEQIIQEASGVIANEVVNYHNQRGV